MHHFWRVVQPRHRLKLKKNSKQYEKLAYNLTASLEDANEDFEVLAYALETELGKGKSNSLSLTIHEILKEIL